jgi:hypothetical protein
MVAKRKTAKRKPAKRRSAPAKRKRAHLVGVRLTPGMKDALDEVAFEWRTTRAAVVRELMEHALKTHPKAKRRT